MAEDESHLIQTLLNQEDDDIERDDFGNVKVGTRWNIVSGKWYRRWRTSKGLSNYSRVEDSDSQELVGPVDNSDLLLDFQNYYRGDGSSHLDWIMKPRLYLEDDFFMFPPKAWKVIVDRYGAKPDTEIYRYSIKVRNRETQAEVVLRKVQLAVASVAERRLLSPKDIYFSRHSTIEFMKGRVAAVLKGLVREDLLAPANIRVWKLDQQSSFEGDVRKEFDECEAGTLLDFPGRLLRNLTETLDEAEVIFETTLVAEIKETEGNWLYRDEGKPRKVVKCEHCTSIIEKQPFTCYCKKYLYCDSVCRGKDFSFHPCGNNPMPPNRSYQSIQKSYVSYSASTSRSSVRSIPENISRSSTSRDGVCGLHNLGNTCFMNSGLQCLSNTEGLTRTFLEDRHLQDLNPDNPIGTQCKLVKAFATLMKEMWFGSDSSVSPWYFKRELGDFVPQFYGFQQQDSHELIVYTLDLIHEDLNRVKKKPVPQEINTEGLSEAEIATQFWENHLSRNQSFVVDLMHGQYRSQVTCPECSNVSLTFDPFVSVSVAFVPKTTHKSFEPIFVPLDLTTSLVKLRVRVANRCCAGDVKAAVAGTLGKDKDTLFVAKAFNFSVVEFLSDRTDVSELSTFYPMVVLEIPQTEGKISILLDIMKKPDQAYYQKTSFAHTRVLQVPEGASLKDLHLLIHRFFLSAKRVELSDSELQTRYEEDFSRDSPAKYAVNIVNLQREKMQFSSSTRYTSSYSPTQCDFCKRKDCFNCPLPNDAEVSFKEFVQQNQSGKMFKIEIILRVAQTQEMRSIVETSIHPSVGEGAREDLEVKSQSHTLQECLQFSGQPEKLDAENEVYCSKCQKHVQAYKQMGIYRLPEILILQLKRFKEKGYRKEKDDRLIHFPLEGLDMSPFVVGPTTGPLVYDLYAVSNHFGSLGGGHYTAYAKNWKKNEWLSFNDSNTSGITGSVQAAVVTASAYVLFYRRRASGES